MHDLKALREQIDALRDGMRRRGKLDQLGPLIDRAEALDRDRRLNIQAVEERKAARNAASQEVARRKKAKESADDVVAQSRALGEEIGRLEAELAGFESELERIMYELPNLTLADVPSGGEECNVIVREWGSPRMEPGLKPHWDIASALGILDLERGAKITGSGFVVYRGAGARLVRSLMNLFLDVHTREHGYEEIWVPAVVNRAAMTGTAQLPKFEDDMYALKDDDLFLIPTAEVPVTNLYRDELLDAGQLPRGFCAYSPCFRREAGSAGKDTRGILRVHEFDKVELVRYSTPEGSAQEHELMTRHATTLLERLGLPYRVKLLAAGDTGFASAKTFDLEAYAPGVGAWLEVSSSSTFTEFQARRANIRYRPRAGEKPEFVHTLNASGVALPRTIAALLEVHQQADGSVTLPRALVPYFGAERIAPRGDA